MARKQVVEWIDDLTGEQIPDGSRTPTVPFALDGVRYEIDLSIETRAELEAALKPFIAAGRKVPNVVSKSRFQPPARVPAKMDQAQRKAIREWWETNWEKAKLPEPNSGRGRIPEEVIEAHTEHRGLRVTKPVKDPFKP